MKRALIDTSSYEEILLSFSPAELRFLEERRAYAVEGFVVIRKELRDVPKDRLLDVGAGKKAKLRLALLALYDNLTSGRSYALEEAMVKAAEEYFTAYVAEGGGKGLEEVGNDFEIVACASYKQVDIVVSEDVKTMWCPEALMAYEKVNAKKGLRVPKFTKIADLKKELEQGLTRLGGVGLD